MEQQFLRHNEERRVSVKLLLSRLSVPNLESDTGPSGQIYAQTKKAIGSVPKTLSTTPRSTSPQSREATVSPSDLEYDRITTMTTLSTTAHNPLVRVLHTSGVLAEDLDYHVVRASMVIMFFFFGYQKWFPYEFERLVPFISNGPLIWWLYPVFGHAGASYFLGVSEWTFGSLLLAGFWDKRLGVLGALGSTGTFIATVTIIPFMPEGWDIAAGGFPAMTGNVPFLMKDVVLLAVSLYLLRQDVVRLTRQ
jgi:uncharacterized membrane protein YkgB